MSTRNFIFANVAFWLAVLMAATIVEQNLELFRLRQKVSEMEKLADQDRKVNDMAVDSLEKLITRVNEKIDREREIRTDSEHQLAERCRDSEHQLEELKERYENTVKINNLFKEELIRQLNKK